jgi:hypothetical protein
VSDGVDVKVFPEDTEEDLQELKDVAKVNGLLVVCGYVHVFMCFAGSEVRF